MYVFNPIVLFVNAEPSVSVPAHIIRLLQGMPFLNASCTVTNGLLSIFIMQSSNVPTIGGNAVLQLFINSKAVTT